jgi:hypothetical protein
LGRRPHLLRYQSETSLYYASINRRDGTSVIKKKVTGGPDNGGTYYDLTPYVAHAVPYSMAGDHRNGEDERGRLGHIRLLSRATGRRGHGSRHGRPAHHEPWTRRSARRQRCLRFDDFQVAAPPA